MRLVLVSRRFWPLIGGAEVAMSNLAVALQEAGHETTVLTARWQSDWPAEIRHRGVRVIRLQQPRGRGWGTWCYLRNLSRWLRHHRDSFDLVFVSMLKHDAYASVSARRHFARPVVLRVGGGGATGDCRWHDIGRFGKRIRERTRQADGFVAVSPPLYEEMCEAGYPRGRIRVIANGVILPKLWTPELRAAARSDLAEFQAALEVEPSQPVVVYVGRLHLGKGLTDLIRAWPSVARRLPEARLWIVGEGPDAPEIWQAIKDRDLTRSIILPGVFDDPAEIVRAADLFVLPSHEEGLSMALLEAMALGIPVVATDIPGNRSVVEHGVTGLLTPPRDPSKLAHAILQSLENPSSSRRLASAARHQVESRYSIDRMATEHIEFFQAILESQARPSE